AAIHALKSGKVFRYADARNVPVDEIKTPDDFLKLLLEGGCWMDAPVARKAAARFSLLGGDPKVAANLREIAAAGRLGIASEDANRYPLALVPYGWRGAAGTSALPPILTKLYRESGVRDGGACVSLHPDTAHGFGLQEGDTAEIETRCGSCRKQVCVDSAVMPGVIVAAVGPARGELGLNSPEQASILDICGAKDGCTWRVARASVRKV
ncbi:MAG: molybdopterin dinucleotide binding domain-containing protein, partial [Bryobacteraceae bacterium]